MRKKWGETWEMLHEHEFGKREKGTHKFCKQSRIVWPSEDGSQTKKFRKLVSVSLEWRHETRVFLNPT